MKKTPIKLRYWIKNLNIKKRKLHSSKVRTGRISGTDRCQVKFGRKLSLFVPSERPKIVKILKSVPQNTFNKLYLDFYDLETIEPLTALHIVHFLNKYNNETVKFKSRNSKNIIPKAVFKLLGLNKVFGLRDINKTNYNTIVDDWSMFSGENCDLPPDMIEHIHVIKQKFKDQTIPFKLVTAINEAINNVIQHAYTDVEYRKWYVLTHIDETSISVVVSDLGLSIPVTAPVSLMNAMQGRLSNAKDLLADSSLKLESLKNLKDSQLIKSATDLNSTRTNEKGRGKGFDDILNLVKNTNEFPEISRVNTSVLSRKGSYLLESNSDGSTKERTLKKNFEDFPSKIDGTVISWVINLA